DPLLNSLYTLFDNRNYLKVYENWFGGAGFQLGFDNGVRIRFDAVAEDRLPVHNTTAYSFTKQADSLMLPNHPYELAHIPFERHQAFVITTGFQFQPGQRYIQYPYHKQSVGSDYPTFAVQYSKGVRGVFGSDIDFDKWKLSVFDDVNLRMLGNFKYRFSMGGFLNNVRVAIPDMQHFNGNQTIYTAKYVNSFQLAPYYRYSNTESWYGVVHAEHHFNGLLTNKIPLFNRLKWYLVAGSNAFYVNNDNYYVEAFAGLENIFKLLRVDIVSGFQAAPGNHVAVRVGFGGLLGNSIRNQSDDVSY
ncbi:MAG TPA: DUF5686 family protein, partial [Flavisolibacter sp.]